ncbi:MAG TPA: DUF4105 domain-containing protein [Thermomonas sp.]|jgi:hypothetical protein|nr:DUF4105 domain-containing protein [Thermomonas sp.]HPW12604.1 DUF4105 domain-containing protein [Thermomonas sp.]
MRITDALRVATALLLACALGLAHAQSVEPSGSASPVLAPASDAPRIGVVTMGPGDVFWERFGHDAIVVDDGAPAGPTSYNFGFFDLAEDGFIGRFVRGEMEYMLVALPLEDDLRYYREVGRGARLQWLDLDPAQARSLAAALAENAKPENARYRYDYYTDNCASRVRDAIDRALGGQLRRQLDVRSSGDTYRTESVRLASPAAWMRVGFDLGLGPFADRPLTRWQQAFLPRRLADDLREATRADGRPLVAEEIELLPQRQAAEPVGRAPRLWPWLLAGVLAGTAVLVLAGWRPRLLAGFAGAFWATCGLLGLVLALGWAFTAHHALWANRNLLLLNPLCLALIPGAWALLRGRMPSSRFRTVLIVLAAMAALACLPLWLQAQPQRNGHWIALLLPIHAALARAWARRPHA